MARGASTGSMVATFQPSFGVEFYLLASVSIRLASIAMRWPLTRPSSMQRTTFVSNRCRSSSLLWKRPWRFLESIE